MSVHEGAAPAAAKNKRAAKRQSWSRGSTPKRREHCTCYANLHKRSPGTTLEAQKEILVDVPVRWPPQPLSPLSPALHSQSTVEPRGCAPGSTAVWCNLTSETTAVVCGRDCYVSHNREKAGTPLCLTKKATHAQEHQNAYHTPIFYPLECQSTTSDPNYGNTNRHRLEHQGFIQFTRMPARRQAQRTAIACALHATTEVVQQPSPNLGRKIPAHFSCSQPFK